MERKGKNVDSSNNPLSTATYGTQRANAYRLLEDALNLRDTKIYDTIHDADGEHRVLNRERNHPGTAEAGTDPGRV